MPTIELRLDGHGGAFAELLAVHNVVEAPDKYPLRIETVFQRRAGRARNSGRVTAPFPPPRATWR
jgi:hypothetical protein